MKPNDDSLGSSPAQNGYRREFASVEPFTAVLMKVITLRRRGNAPLGFSIRGGWEHGTGIFVSEVVSGSIAQRQGLRVGDQIIRINGFSIHRAIHMEVLNLLKTCPGIVLKIKRVGILPVKERDKDPVTWKIVDHDSPLICSEQVTHSRVNGNGHALESCIIVKIEINVPGSSSLGCSIAKGPAEMPGIYMCTVKPGGPADQSGLEVGDQILDMNGTSFADVKLNEAVTLMKSTRNIRLSVKKGAGVCLFLENNQRQHVTNGNQNEDAISTARSISNRPSPPPKDQAFSNGSCSSKSEDSSFQSSDSEKEYSISEEVASSFGGRSSAEPPPPAPACPWVSGKEAEKGADPAKDTFLQELQKVAARMSSAKVEGKDAEQPREESSKGKKYKEDAIDRMRHEMLMEEFREAHRKMFGNQSVIASEDTANGNGSITSDAPKVCAAPKVKAKPPPPPPPQKESQKITVNGQVPSLQSQTLPRPEKTAAAPARTSMDDIAHKPRQPQQTFRVTVTDTGRPHQGKGAAPKPRGQGALVEVTPWATRL